MIGLVSIHDLMPETMDRVETLLAWLHARQVPPVTLLVVPGKPWTPAGIDRLRRLADAGHPLAAHGWHHRTRPRRLWHRAHAALISRDVAEHLDLDSPGIADLMCRSHAWFARHQLPEPRLYVPPAWALGRLRAGDRARLPFRQIETTRGLLHLAADGRCRRQLLPLTGYEADTAARACLLRRWNACQAAAARCSGRALRISIHPDDLQLRLQDQLEAQLAAVEEFVDYASHCPG